MKKTLLSLILLLFVSQAHSGMKCIDGLRKILSREPHKSFKVIKKNDRYWRYRKYESGENFVSKKNKLFHDIDFWRQVGERDIRLRELRKKQARSLVNETIKLDRSEISLILLRPMFVKVQISYFKMQRNNFISEKLLQARSFLIEGKIDSAIDIITELKDKYQLKERVNIKPGKANLMIKEIDRALTRIENSNIDITIEFAQKYAEYTETMVTLTNIANKPGKLKQKAIDVLDLLHPKKLIAEQFEHFEKFEPIEHVQKETMRDVVINNRISEVIYLKKELRMEKWSSIISRLSATQIYELTDSIIKKFPWLNTPSIRSQIRYTVDNKEILTHYPNIDRMVADGNSPKVMWEYLLHLDARDRTTDSLIRTFSRRIDTRAEWRSVKGYGALRSKKLKEQGHAYDLEVRLYDKMIEMEKSVLGLPPLAPWHRSGNTKFVRFILDGVLLGAFAYGSYYFLGDLIPDMSEEKEPNSSNDSENTSSTSSSTDETSVNIDESSSTTDADFPNPSSGALELEDLIEKAASDACGQFASCPISPN